MNVEAEKLLAGKDPAIAALARQVCDVILARFPDATVTADEQNIVAPARAHVTLGIAGGASLPDPAGLMEGGGKVHRHIKIRAAADLERPELATLMDVAIANVS